MSETDVSCEIDSVSNITKLLRYHSLSALEANARTTFHAFGVGIFESSTAAQFSGVRIEKLSCS
jgi:hypothetical protein